MRKYLLLAALLLFPALGFAATEPYSTFMTNTTTVGPSIPSNGLFAVTSGGHTYSATAAQVGAGGGGAPGGLNTQIQYNNGGSLGGLVSYYAQAYGDVPDAYVVGLGVTTTSGNPTIGISTEFANFFPNFQFTTAMVGSTVTISNPAMFDISTPPVSNFTGTISSVNTGANTATLNSNVTFTSATYKYASLRLYKTVNTTSIQNAFNAAHASGQGGEVIFPPGGSATGLLTFYDNMKLTGASPTTSFLMLAANSNSDLLEGQNFASQTGSGSFTGIINFEMEDIGLDGNAGANTGSNSGLLGIGTGDGVRMYGWGIYTNRVFINNFAADGWHSEWNTGAGDPSNGVNSENSYLNNMQLSGNRGWGITWGGPHDGTWSNITTTNNNNGGATEVTGGTSLNVFNYHGYQNGGPDLNLAFGVQCYNCIAENGMILQGFDSTFYGGLAGISFASSPLGLQLGTTGGSAPFANRFYGFYAKVISNKSSVGFQDSWVGGQVDSFTGNAYNPDAAFGVLGIQSRLAGFGWSSAPSLSLGYNSSWPVTLTEGATNLFSMTGGNGNNFLVENLANNVGIGHLAATTSVPDAVDAVGGVIGLVGTTTSLPTVGLVSVTTNELDLTTSGLKSIGVNNIGHAIVQGATPVATAGATACGTSPAAAGTDNAGVVTMGTSPSGSCVVTYANAWTAVPDGCDCTDNTTSSQGCRALSITTTSFALSATTTPFTAADKVSYRCHSHQF